MKLNNETLLPADRFVWRRASGPRSTTVVVKATFLLEAGESRLAPLEAQVPIHEADLFDGSDERGALRTASDIVPFKEGVDVVLVGSAFSPKGPVPSLLTILRLGAPGHAEIERTIRIIGNRTWTPDGALTSPEPFSEMPLTWTRSAGGPGTVNPSGVRTGPDALGLEPPQRRLPNLVSEGRQQPKMTDVLEPLGYGPIAPSWPSRAALSRRYGEHWDPYGWMGGRLPDDLSPQYFNVAPPQQRLKRFRFDQPLFLQGLHRTHVFLSTALTKVVPQALIDAGERSTKRSMDLQCDTVWIDTESGTCTLTWRGWFEDDADDEGTIHLFHSEPLPFAVRAKPSREVVALAPSLEGTKFLDDTAAAPAAGRVVASSFQVAIRTMPAVQDITLPPPVSLPARPLLDATGPIPAPSPSRIGVPPFFPDTALAPLSPDRAVVGKALAQRSDPMDATPASISSGPASGRGPLTSTPASRSFEPTMALPPGPAQPVVSPPPPVPPPPVRADALPRYLTEPVPPPRLDAPPPSEAIRVGRGSDSSLWAEHAPGSPAGYPEQAPPPAVSAIAPPLMRSESAARQSGQPDAVFLDRADRFGYKSASAPSSRGSVAAVKGSALQFSNDAAGGARPRVVSLRRQEALPPVTGLIVDIIWADREAHPRVRQQIDWREMMERLQPRMDDIPSDMTADKRKETRQRREVSALLARISTTDPQSLEGCLANAVTEDGTLLPPLVVAAGFLEMPFGEVETLKATLAAVAPFVPGDESLKSVVDTAEKLLQTPWITAFGENADGQTRRVREAFLKRGRSADIPPLEATTARILLQQRAYQKRTLLGSTFLRGLLYSRAGAEKSIPVPVYLPEAIANDLPAFTGFTARVLAEVRPQAEQYERHAASLLAIALGRVLPGRG